MRSRVFRGGNLLRPTGQPIRAAISSKARVLWSTRGPQAALHDGTPSAAHILHSVDRWPCSPHVQHVPLNAHWSFDPLPSPVFTMLRSGPCLFPCPSRRPCWRSSGNPCARGPNPISVALRGGHADGIHLLTVYNALCIFVSEIHWRRSGHGHLDGLTSFTTRGEDFLELLRERLLLLLPTSDLRDLLRRAGNLRRVSDKPHKSHRPCEAPRNSSVEKLPPSLATRGAVDRLDDLQVLSRSDVASTKRSYNSTPARSKSAPETPCASLRPSPLFYCLEQAHCAPMVLFSCAPIRQPDVVDLEGPLAAQSRGLPLGDQRCNEGYAHPRSLLHAAL